MNIGPNHPSGHGGGGGARNRRRRGRRGGSNRPGQGGGPRHHHQQGGGGGGKHRHQQDPIYTAPMDHSYRANLGQAQGGNQPNQSRGRGGRPGRPGFAPQYFQPEPEPLPVTDASAAPRIFAFVEDLFFLAKIQETSRKLNVKVEFVKNDQDIFDRMEQNGHEKPALIIFDLNNVNAKPLATIPKLRSKLKKTTNIIGFLSHLQGDLKMKAMEAGCDMVLPRSAFSQNLPQLLRRHGAPEDLSQDTE